MPAIVVDEFAWLEEWYRSRCDGTWEHQHGVSIRSCDNPGWWVQIDVDKENFPTTTDMVLKTDGDPPSEANGLLGGPSWLLCQIKGGKFDAAGDPTRLREIIRCFRTIISERRS